MTSRNSHGDSNKEINYEFGLQSVLEQMGMSKTKKVVETPQGSENPNTQNDEEEEVAPLVSSAIIKNQIDALTNNIDRIESNNRAYHKEMLTKMLQQDIRDVELNRITDLLKEID